MEAALIRDRFPGTDPCSLTPDQFYGLLYQTKHLNNLRQGKPPEGTWFEKNTVPGSARPLVDKAPNG